MRIFFSAEYYLRVARRMSLMTFSPGSFCVPDFRLIFAPWRGTTSQKFCSIYMQSAGLERFRPMFVPPFEMGFDRLPFDIAYANFHVDHMVYANLADRIHTCHPWRTSTSTCRNFVPISSGWCRLFGIFDPPLS